MEKQKRRNDRFGGIRNDSSISAPGKARWNAYESSAQNFLNMKTVSATANWQNCGPTNQGGRMIAHAFDPTNVNIVWAGSASGGLWKTVNGGNSWAPMTDNIPSLAVGTIGINPQNTNEMLIGTGEGYLFSSWFQYGVGVLKSTDGGITWNTTSLTAPDSSKFACTGIAWDPVNPSNVFLATTYGIYRSQNGGTTWTLNKVGPASNVVINKKNPQVVYASFQDYSTYTGGIYKSTNGGSSWQLLAGGLPPVGDYGFTSLTICDSFPNILYAGVSQPYSSSLFGEMRGLFKSSDAGATWTQIIPFQDFYCYPPPYQYICQGWYNNIVAISPVDSNLVFCGGIYLYNTTDGGATWDYADWIPSGNPAYMHPDHHSFGFNPLNTSICYSFNDGGIYKSTNSGSSWTEKNNGLVTMQYYYAASSATDPGLIVGGTQDNGIWYNNSLAASTLWSQFATGDGFFCNIDYNDANTWYTTELFNGRMKSNDGGASYYSINNGINGTNFFITPLIMHPTNNKILYTADDNNVYTSIDSGATWTSISNAGYVTIMTIDKVNPMVIYICNDPVLPASTVQRSTDGGATWTVVASPGPKVTDIECDPNNSGILYATRGKYTSGQQLYKSTDFGDTWVNITNNFPSIPANTIAVNPNNVNHIYIGCDLGVYLSIDGGSSWSPYNTNLPNVVVQDMHYYTGDSSIRAATHGRGFWRTQAADPALISISENNALNFSLCTFPNPASDEVNIHFNLKKEEKISVTILNSLGQEIVLLANAVYSSGPQSIKWNAKNSKGRQVSPGVYYIRVQSAHGSETMKHIIK